MSVEIKVTIDGKEMTMDEARKVYNELKKLFGGEKENPPAPYLPKPDRWEPYRRQWGLPWDKELNPNWMVDHRYLPKFGTDDSTTPGPNTIICKN